MLQPTWNKMEGLYVSLLQTVFTVYSLGFWLTNVSVCAGDIGAAVRYTTEESAVMLGLHNDWRGNVTPPAADMEFMSWDDQLADLAQRWAETCTWKHGLPDNRTLRGFGQNLWAGYGTTRGRVPSVVSPVYAWTNEQMHYDYDTNTCSDKRVCGHYTQVVWASTSRLGCGRAFCRNMTNNGWTNRWIVVCNYYPGGNIRGIRPYTSGPSCTRCASGTGQCFKNKCRSCSDIDNCECRLTCQNCGTLELENCTCKCPKGWHGNECGKPCVDSHEYCGKNHGWPGRFTCPYAPYIPRYCPLMCGVCEAEDPDFVCSQDETTGEVDTSGEMDNETILSMVSSTETYKTNFTTATAATSKPSGSVSSPATSRENNFDMTSPFTVYSGSEMTGDSLIDSTTLPTTTGKGENNIEVSTVAATSTGIEIVDLKTSAKIPEKHETHFTATTTTPPNKTNASVGVSESPQEVAATSESIVTDQLTTPMPNVSLGTIVIETTFLTEIDYVSTRETTIKTTDSVERNETDIVLGNDAATNGNAEGHAVGSPDTQRQPLQLDGEFRPTDYDIPELCNKTFTAIASDGEMLYLFQGKYMWRIHISTGSLMSTHQETIASSFALDGQKITAAYYRNRTTELVLFTYFYMYVLLNGQIQPGYPHPVHDLGVPFGVIVNAALHNESMNKSLLFTGRWVWRYDDISGTVDEGYPKRNRFEFRGMRRKPTAAFKFIDGNYYVLHDDNTYAKINPMSREIDNRLRFHDDFFGCRHNTQNSSSP